MTLSKPIEERALLVSLNISQWTARKRDKKVTREATRAHDAAEDSGNFNKSLLRRDTLADITKVVSAARSVQDEMTLSWGDNGDRILNSALFADYSRKMQALRHQFDAKVDEFAVAYPNFIHQARKELGTMYDPEDYPTDVRGKFSFKVGMTVLATVNDFRVQLSTDHIEHIKREMTRDFDERQKNTLKECYEKVRKVVARISENCSKDDPKIYDSLMGNARDLVDILPALNLTGDTELAQIGADLHAMLVPTNRLKADKQLRKDTAKKADDILARLNWA